MEDRTAGEVELIMRPGVPPDQAQPPPPPPIYKMRRESGLLIEQNLSVPLRDGTRIYIDLYRPDGLAPAAGLPVLLGWSPYGKHRQTNRLWPAADVNPEWLSPLTAFEAPDPVFWCPQGYAVIYPDPRGSWYSEGELRHNGIGEGEDCFDLIEWSAAQSWSNGRVGMTGVSYLAAIQYLVASLKPPHLAAINPWEGFSDWYREFATHGGIPETSFSVRGPENLRFSTTRTEDTARNIAAHPLYDAYWKSKEVDLEAIDIPAYVVASWSDQGLHTRGTLEAFRRMRSPQKWLEVHGQKKWAHFYLPSSRRKQVQFFDHYLKGTDDSVLSWPPVQFEVRDRAGQATVRSEGEWPPARTRPRPLYLDAATGLLCDAQPVTTAQIAYDPLAADGQVAFDYRFAEDTELTGTMAMHIWAEAVGAQDMDLFVAIQKIDAAGKEVPFVYYAFYENGPVALGWLRASHRALDETRSTPLQPVHRHDKEEPLTPGEPVPLDIEIWPSSTRFLAGERLRLLIKGRDIYDDYLPNMASSRHERLRNAGLHRFHTGGKFESYLLVPVLPPVAP